MKEKRKCKGCDKDISHKHINAKFHSQKCKDTFHNKFNPRGYGLVSRERSNNYESEQDYFSDKNI